MSERHWRLFVEDILESIEKIENYVRNMKFTEFENDTLKIDAVVRNLEIIGEATKNIPEDMKSKYQNINWKGMIGLRNRIIHDYFGVDLEIIWVIIQNELPKLKEQIKEILKKEVKNERKEL